MKLSEAINKDLTSDRVHWLYANRATIRIWNDMKPEGDPPIFCGWYWMHGTQEGGPFRCESACMRDAWYRVVKKMQPPGLFHSGGMVAAPAPIRVGEVPSHRTLPTSRLRDRNNIVEFRK